MTHVWLKWTGWFLACAVLQSTLVPYITVFGARPDLLMLVFFHLVIKWGVMTGTIVGFVLGLALDIFSPALIGSNALSMSVIGFIAGHFNEKILRLDALMRAILLFSMFILNDAILMTVHIMMSDGDVGTLFVELLVTTLPRAFYTLIFAVIPFVWANFVKPSRLVD